MLTLRSHALITSGFFAALLLIGWGGNLLDAFGLIADAPAVRLAVIVLMLGLCAGLAFSAVPLIVLIVLRFQAAAGNADRPIIRSLLAHQRAIVFTLWAVMAAGLAVAVPAAILGGALDKIEFRR